MTTAGPARRAWILPVVLAGVAYTVIGVLFPVLETSPASVEYLRWAAWVASAAVGAAHIGYEHFRLHNPPRQAALHAAAGVALGAFGLALAANLHELASATAFRPRMLVALAAWPLLTAVPAFLLALVVATGLGFSRKH